MTTDQLQQYFNNTYGTEKPWPKTFVVDRDTLKNVVYSVFRLKVATRKPMRNHIRFSIGPNGGPYFKTVELILGEQRSGEDK